MPRCFQINPADNVATMLDDADAACGVAEVLGGGNGVTRIDVNETIALGHKVALRPIATGEPVVKFGVSIGVATRDIRAGDWVHLHNCASRFDQRSGALDLHSGATTDTVYE